ncbi:MAG TPA: IPT/TIG domain-containing protein [Kofleriaceae bacterium]
MVRLAIVMGLYACSGGSRPAAPVVPANSSAADCASTAAVVLKSLTPEEEAAVDHSAIKTEIAKRCDDDKWTVEARNCLSAAQTKDAVHDCGYQHLTQAQQDKLDHSTAELTSFDFKRAMAAMTKFKDELCACKDQPCVERVSDAMTKWSKDMSKKYKEPPKMTEEDSKQAAAIGEQMGNCMQNVMSASAPAPGDKLKVTGIDPASGDSAGGTYVKISGTRFLADGARNVKVYFGSKQGTVVRVASDTELVVEAPAGKAKETVDVLVIFEPGGEIKLVKAFTFEKKKK